MCRSGNVNFACAHYYILTSRTPCSAGASGRSLRYASTARFLVCACAVGTTFLARAKCSWGPISLHTKFEHNRPSSSRDKFLVCACAVGTMFWHVQNAPGGPISLHTKFERNRPSSSRDTKLGFRVPKGLGSLITGYPKKSCSPDRITQVCQVSIPYLKRVKIPSPDGRTDRFTKFIAPQ